MINLDTRLLKVVDENELWLLCQLAKRINSFRECWPSNATLCKDTGWHIEKLQRVKKSLVQKGLLQIKPRKIPDGQTSNMYYVTTKYVSLFVSLPDLQGGAGIQGDPIPENMALPLSENHTTEVSSNEVLTNEHDYVDDVINHLNQEKRKYGIKGNVSWTKERHSLIVSRIKTTVVSKSDILKMITHRCEVWKGSDFERYIRIETLFRPSKFMGYIEEAQAAPEKHWTERNNCPEPDNGFSIPGTQNIW